MYHWSDWLDRADGTLERRSAFQKIHGLRRVVIVIVRARTNGNALKLKPINLLSWCSFECGCRLWPRFTANRFAAPTVLLSFMPSAASVAARLVSAPAGGGRAKSLDRVYDSVSQHTKHVSVCTSSMYHADCNLRPLYRRPSDRSSFKNRWKLPKQRMMSVEWLPKNCITL